jgi:coenzyme PQQ precursor peptide PqqA
MLADCILEAGLDGGKQPQVHYKDRRRRPLLAPPHAGRFLRANEKICGGKPQESTMAWTTPEICEVCVGMEVTAYASAVI